MSKLVMNIKNEQNMKAMVEWCKQYHIAYQIIEDVSNQPNLVDDTVNTTTKVVKSGKDKPDPLKSAEMHMIGTWVRAYDKELAIRYWARGSFTPDKVKGAINKAVREAGAEYNKDLEAFTFKTKKAYTAFCKAQKDRESK